MATSGAMSTDNSYIKYKITITQNSQSVANNTSNITVTVNFYRTNTGYETYGSGTVYCKINGITYSAAVDSSDKITNSGINLFSKTLNITHSENGTKTLTCSAWINHSRVTSTEQSYSQVLSTIPRAATITAAPNFNDEQNPAITYNNQAGNAVTTLQAMIQNSGGTKTYAARNLTKTGTTYTFSLTDAERTALRTDCTGKSMKVRFLITTVIGSNTFNNYVTKTLSIINGEPTISASVVDRGVSNSLTLTGNENVLISGFNKAYASMTATGKKGATISSYKITNNSKTVNAANGEFDNTNNGTFTFYVTDSRGFTTSKTVTKTLINYFAPTVNMEVAMPTAEGNTTMKVSGTFFNSTFGAINNTGTLYYRVKQDYGDYGSWIAITPTVSGNSYTFELAITGLDYRSAYTYQARIVDKINDLNSAEIKVKTTPVFDWGENDFNVNGTYSIRDNVVIRQSDINNNIVFSANAGDMYFRPNGTTETEGEMVLFSNGELSLSGNTMADFVVEFKKSGIWTYRKWNNGFVELWAVVTPAYANTNVLLSSYNLPFTLASVLTVNATLNSTDNAASQLTENVKVLRGPSAVTVSVHNSSTGYTSSTTKSVSIVVNGLWK